MVGCSERSVSGSAGIEADTAARMSLDLTTLHGSGILPYASRRDQIEIEPKDSHVGFNV
jgi:hypothetical protein